MPLGVESLEREGVGDFLTRRAKNRKKLHAFLKNLGEVSEEVALERAMHADAFAKLGDLDELRGWGAFAWGEGGGIWFFGIVRLWVAGLRRVRCVGQILVRIFLERFCRRGFWGRLWRVGL